MQLAETSWHSDKGGVIVILTRDHDLKEPYRQLAEVEIYIPLDKDPTYELQINIKEITSQALQNKLISKKEWAVLNVSSPTLAKFYLVPKIHKDLVSPPGRPIVSTRGTVLELLSVFIDSYLCPLLIEIPSYIKDTAHFLQILRDNSKWAKDQI